MDTDGTDGETLELTTREEVDVTVHDVVQLENVADLFHVAQRGSALEEEANALVGASDSPGDLVDILGLNHGLEVIFQELGEVVLEFRSTEVLDNILPVRGVGVAAQVGLELSGQDLQGSALSDTVGSDQTQNLTGSGHRQTMQLEAVGAISVGDLALEVGGQIDDGNGVEGALLGANTTTDAEGLGNEGEARFGGDFNAELATSNDRARLFAFLTTFSRATLVAVDDGDTSELVRHVGDDDDG